MKKVIFFLLSTLVSVSAMARETKTYLYYNIEDNCGVEFSVNGAKIKDIIVRSGPHLLQRLSADPTKKSIADIPTLTAEMSRDKMVLINKEDLEGSQSNTVVVIKADFVKLGVAILAESNISGVGLYDSMPLALEEVRWFRETNLKKQEVGPESDFMICRDLKLISTGQEI